MSFGTGFGGGGFGEKTGGSAFGGGFGEKKEAGGNFGAKKEGGAFGGGGFGEKSGSAFGGGGAFGSGGGTGSAFGGGTGFGSGNAGGGAFGGGGSSFGGGGAFGGAGGGSSFGGGGGGGGGNKCYNCQGEGHISRDCPQGQKSRGCFNCGEEGHRSNECPNPRKPREPREGGGGGGKCYNCNGEGHLSRDCTEPRKPRDTSGGGAFGGGGFGSGGGGGGAFGGGGFGASSGGAFGGGGFGSGGGGDAGGGQRPSGCFNCGEEGHRSAECPNPRKPREGGGSCFNCGKEGHLSKDCTEERQQRLREDGTPIVVSTYVPEDTKVESLFIENRIEKGIMFDKFFDAKVQVTRGGNPAMDSYKEVISFDEVNLTTQIRENVNKAGYSKPTPIQRHAIPLIAAGADLMGCAQTGSGKTAAFLLPVMQQLFESSDLDDGTAGCCKPRCIILAPTRELAVQIHGEALKLAHGTVMNAALIYGGTAVGHQRDKVMRGASILTGTTGRMKHFVSEGIVSLEKVRYVILDEADRMLDMGFSGDVEELLGNPNIPPKEERQTLMFSATFDDEVQRLAATHLRKDFVMVTIDAIGCANRCITQDFILCERGEKKVKFLELLNVDLETYSTSKDADVYKKKTIVFVDRKTFADTLGGLLTTTGIPSMTIHGDRLQQQREQALRDFRTGRTPVLIATAVAERGLDIKGVDHVINYDLPKTRDEYVHRIGRTGRVGNAGRATSFYDAEKDSSLAPELVKVLSEVEQPVPDFLQQAAGFSGGAGFASGGGEW